MDSTTPDRTITMGFQIKEIRVGLFTINESLVDDRNDVNFSIGLQHQFNPDNDEHIVQLELEATYRVLLASGQRITLRIFDLPFGPWQWA